MGIFEDDVEGEVLGKDFRGTRRGNLDLDPIPTGEGLRLPRNLAIEENTPLVHELGDTGAGELQPGSQPNVEPVPVAFLFHDEDPPGHRYPARLSASRTGAPSISSSRTVS
jgi:hypothetical protein